MCITVILIIMKIGKELAIAAKKKGICKEWFNSMKVLEDKDALIEMYVKGIDFCLANDFPSNDYIRTNFTGKMEAYGVHLDESLNTANDRRVVALGRCLGRIEVNGFSVSEIFVKHESDLLIVAKGNSFVMIDMFDNSKLHVIASADAKVCVNHYGGDLKTESCEDAIIKVIEKNKKSY